MKKRCQIVVHGHVQGVFFRASTVEEAEHCGLTGWVRNLPDRTVEITAEGDVEDLRAFRDWCRHGPPYASVSSIDYSETARTGEFEGFRIVF